MRFSIFGALVALTSCFSETLASSISFDEFKFLYGKTYTTEEEENKRRVIFEDNVRKIDYVNSQNYTHTLAVNVFADMTQAEFYGVHRTSKHYARLVKEHTYSRVRNGSIQYSELPDAIDWSSKNAVTPVKNQEQCGSCWSFSTTGAIEGIHAITTGNLVSLSEQQLVDCSTDYGNEGCNGGMPIWAYQYVIDNGGLCSEDAYAYTAQDGTCQASKCKSVASISGYVNVTINSGEALKEALAKQPVSVIIEADQLTFQFYNGGVLTTGCGNNLDHAVLAVGYGSLNGQEYWKVKNSWGTSWGMNGYILMGADSASNAQNGGSGVCGVLSMPTYPTM